MWIKKNRPISTVLFIGLSAFGLVKLSYKVRGTANKDWPILLVYVGYRYLYLNTGAYYATLILIFALDRGIYTDTGYSRYISICYRYVCIDTFIHTGTLSR